MVGQMIRIIVCSILMFCIGYLYQQSISSKPLEPNGVENYEVE